MKSGEAAFRFGDFLLDPAQRRLERGGKAIAVSGRYLDALVLLVRENGQLISKDRLHEEVWQGVPVTDEAITQCIRALRKALEDDAANPAFIETVPRHGYRFVATVHAGGGVTQPGAPPVAEPIDGASRQEVMRAGLAGIGGGALAGVAGGLFYGFGLAAQGGAGGATTVLALLAIVTLVAVVGSVGVSFGIAASLAARRNRAMWAIAGGALGGMLEGGLVKLVGVDALNLLAGHGPQGITGALEGLVLGAGVGAGYVLSRGLAGNGMHSLLRMATLAALPGALAGLVVHLAGGRLLGGSLDLLVRTLPDSRLSLDPLGWLAGQAHFSAAAQGVSAVLEGALYSAAIACAMIRAVQAKTPRSG